MLRTVTLFLLLVLLTARPLAAQTTSTSTALTYNDSSTTNTRGAASTGIISETVALAVPAVPVVHAIAEEMPAFPGGPTAFQRFLREKLQYPEEALGKGISGKVHVSFVIDEQGHILDPKVVRGLGSGLDEEALRLVRIMPWWTPGRTGGHPVRVVYTLPIVFRALD